MLAMKSIAQRLIVLTTLLSLSGLPGAHGEATVGKKAPDFAGVDIQGKPHRLADYAGKIVVLEACNLDCPYCANHYKTSAMQSLQKELTDKGVIWLVVNSTNPKNSSYRNAEAAKKEWEKVGMRATAWIDDSSGEIGKAYGLRTTPHIIVIAKDGTVAYNGAVDDVASDSGDPRRARNYVREAVNALLAGKPVEVVQTKPYGCGVKY
jgi:peroxiredoxin